MIKQTIGELLGNNVVLDIEGMDRMYLNLYQPRLQTGGGVATFFREEHRNAKIASTALMGPKGKIMYAYREMLTLTDPQVLHLKQPLPLGKGQRVEVVILTADEKDSELENIRAGLEARGVTEADVRDAVAWARGQN